MVLMMIFMIFMAFGMPKLMENIDPEVLEEMKKSQSGGVSEVSSGCIFQFKVFFSQVLLGMLLASLCILITLSFLSKLFNTNPVAVEPQQKSSSSASRNQVKNRRK